MTGANVGLGNAQFRALFDKSLDAMLIADDQGRYVEANPAACDLLGRSREHIIGQHIADVMLPGLCFETAWQQFQQHGQERGEIQILRGDGSLRDVDYAATADVWPHHHLSILRDVTEQKRLEREVQDLQQQLEQRAHNLEQHNDQLQAEQHQQKQVEAALQQNQDQLHVLIDALPVCISYIDRHQRYRYVNANYQVWFGQSPAELYGKTVAEVVGEAAYNVVQGYIERALAGETVTYEATVPFPIAVRHIHGTLVPDLDPRGQVQGYYAVILDWSDRKQAELELETTRQFLQRILDYLPIAVFAKDAQTLRFVLWNPACTQLMGYPPEAVLGKTDYDLFPAEQADLCISQDREAIASGQLIDLPEEVIVNQDGSFRTIHNRKVAVYDADGQPQFVIGIAEDITERRAAEVSLRQREQEFRALAENAPDMIFRCDRQFRFLYANPKVAELSGMPASDFLGYTSRELGFPDAVVERWESAMDLAFTTAQEQTLEYELPLLGDNHAFYSRIAPEFSSDGQVNSVLIMIREITNLKRAQQQLLQQAEQERLLNTITQHIWQSLNLDQILSTAVREVRSLLQADRVVVYRFNPDWSGNMIAESVVPPWMTILDRNLHDPCFVGALVDDYRLGKSNRIDDLHNSHLAPCYVNLLGQLQVQASLAVPIAREDHLWGLFCVHYCASPHTWQSWEEDLLRRLTGQLAIALQQSELHQQVKQWNLNLEHQVQERTADLQQSLDFEATLISITDKVRDSLDEEQILDAVVVELGQRLSLECCDTGLYSDDRTTSTITHEFVRSLPSSKGTTFLIANSRHTDVYPVLFQGQICQFCDLSPCRFSEEHSCFAILACPIVDDQGILGDLWLLRSRSELFSDAEVRLVQQVAKQCAIALRQSRLYQAAQSQVLALEKLNRLKDDFLSTVSHELRTPMSSIKMATDLLEMQLQQMGLLPNEPYLSTDPLARTPLARYVQVLKDEEHREINLINDLLALTRLDADIEPLVLTSLHLQDWLPHILEPFMMRAQQQQQDLTLTLDPSLPLLVTDLPHFQRILHELLTNACKYTPAGGTVNLSVRANLGILEMVVTNSGVEIPVSERDRIFDRFYRIPNHDPWKHGGTGLGLALVQKLVACLGGTIQVDSGDHQTWFTLRLPIAPS